MKPDHNKIETEREKVDNYIITSCITLIAAFIIIISIKTPSNFILVTAAITSLAALTLTLLFSLWHKFRHPKRNYIFEKEKDKLISDISGRMADFEENIALPAAKGKFLELKGKNPDTPDDELWDKIIDDKGEVKKVFLTYIEKLSYELKELYEDTFRKPLDEKNAKTKYVIDVLARSLRYALFVVGVIFFFVTVILNLI